MTMTVQESWQALLNWFADNQPDAVTALRPPAGDADLDAFADAIGLQLPADHRALYRLADGSDLDIPSVFDDGHWLLPLEQALNHFNTMQDFADEKPIDDFARWRQAIQDGVITVSGPVKPHPFSKHWIPVSSSNGDVHRYIDLDPAPGGDVGQVIEFYPEACSHRVLAKSLAEFLANHVAALRAGDFLLEHDCLIRRDEPADATGMLPAYLENADAELLDDRSVAPPGPDTLTGTVGTLGGTSDEIFFTLHTDDGAEIACVATRRDTRGFSNIAIEQRARVNVKPCRRRRFLFFMKANFLVLEYKAELHR